MTGGSIKARRTAKFADLEDILWRHLPASKTHSPGQSKKAIVSICVLLRKWKSVTYLAITLIEVHQKFDLGIFDKVDDNLLKKGC